jgi:hypothetical protein
VRDALVKRAGSLGVRSSLGAEARNLYTHEGSLQGIETASGRSLAHAVVIATGGKSYPKLGGGGSGYDLARAAGHEIVTPTPALVGLLTRETWPHAIPGISLPDVRVWIDLPKLRKRDVSGEFLLTHRGVSGPAILNISGEVASLLKKHGGALDEVPLRMEVVRGMGCGAWESEIDKWRSSDGNRSVRALLAMRLPRALADAIPAVAFEHGPDPGDTLVSSITREDRRRLADTLAALPLTITGTEGFERAMVTRGGVALGKVDPRTLGSRLVRGLFFAGEVLDLTGPCGGYNLQWAFSSGRLAGISAAGFATD